MLSRSLLATGFLASLCLLVVSGLMAVLPPLSFGAEEEERGDGPSTTAGDDERAAALARLRAAFPRARVYQNGDQSTLWGSPMTAAPTPEEAIEGWLREHGAAIGVRFDELRLVRDVPIRSGKLVSFVYEQTLAGLTVEGSRIQVLALEPRGDDTAWRVVHAAAARTTRAPDNGFPPGPVDAATAVRRVKNDPAYNDLVTWSAPVEVILPAGNGVPRATRAWRFAGAGADRGTPRAFTFFVDTAGGAIVFVRDEVHYAEVDGTVHGMATPGMEPDGSSNPPVETDMRGIRVRGGGSSSTYADLSGEYTLTGLSTATQSIHTSLEGKWVNVIPVQGSAEEPSESVAPPATVDFLFNEDDSEFDTAQVNAFIHTQGTHDFYKARAPSFSGLDSPLEAYTNIAATCNAYFTTFPLSINFYNAGGGCSNTSFTSVVAHEYGHFIVYALGLGQGSFGEGFADTVSLLQYDDPIIGRSFFGPGSPVRTIDTAGVQYPCGGEVHYCGQAIAGVFWELKLGLQETLGDEEGLDEARQLFVDWSLITSGGAGNDAVHPGTVTELLSADDDDGRPENGSPHFVEICEAFELHGLECPEIDPFEFSFPDGSPTSIATDGSTTFRVVILSHAGMAADGTARLYYTHHGAGGKVGVDLEHTGTHEYLASIPPGACGTEVTYYFSAGDVDGGILLSPFDAPTETYHALTADGFDSDDTHDFSADLGWTTGDTADPDDATTGVWARVVPNGTVAAPGADYSADPEAHCWVTGQGTAGASAAASDVDGGKTTLVSPVFDLEGDDNEPVLSYWRWVCTNQGADADGDRFTAEVSNDGGATWVVAEELAGEQEKGWKFNRFVLRDVIAPTSTVRIRFVVEDGGDASLVEAALDDFRIQVVTCENFVVPHVYFARGDCDGNGVTALADAVRLLRTLFLPPQPAPSCERACDTNDDSAINVIDVLVLLDAVYGGVPLVAPYPACGEAPVSAQLSCGETEACP